MAEIIYHNEPYIPEHFKVWNYINTNRIGKEGTLIGMYKDYDENWLAEWADGSKEDITEYFS